MESIQDIPEQNLPKEPTLKEKTAKGLFWSFFDKGGQQIVAFVFGLILANLLDPSDIGLIGVLTVFTAISTTLIDSGFGNALIKEKDEPAHSVYSTIFLFNFFISVILYVALYFSSPVIADFYEKPILETLSKLVFLPIIINALSLVSYIKLVRRVDFHIITRINLTSLIIAGLLAVFFAYRGLGVYSLAIQNVTYSLLRTLFLWFNTKWIPLFTFKKEILSNYFSYSSKIALVGIVNVIFDNLYTLFIGKYYSMSQLGFYSYAKKFHDIPSNAISLSVQDVTFPVLSKLAHEDDRLIRAFRKSIKTASFLLFPCLWGLAMISESFFSVFLKPEWQPSVVMLQILCIASPFYALCVANNNLILAKGQSSLFLKITIIKKVILVICLLVTLKYSIIVMIVGLSVSNFLSYIISITVTSKTINFSAYAQFKDIFPYLILSLIMCVVVYSLSFIVSNHYILLPLQIITGIITYWLLCKSSGSKIYSEVIAEIKKKIL